SILTANRCSRASAQPLWRLMRLALVLDWASLIIMRVFSRKRTPCSEPSAFSKAWAMLSVDSKRGSGLAGFTRTRVIHLPESFRCQRGHA
ncbi:unnamed protein product, partial [Mycena citricolor]